MTSAYMVFCITSAAQTVIRGAVAGMESLTKVEVEKTFGRSVLKRVAQW